jgi:hypothetical protein
MLGHQPLATQPLSSVSVQRALFSESPVLTASGLVDGSVALTWALNPQVAAQGFELRRSQAQAPVSVDQGQPVYQGLDRSFLDTGVSVGVTYYYTVFVALSLAPLFYVPYEPQASDSVVPARVRTLPPVIREYVPYSGEFGAVTQPWPYGRLTESWRQGVRDSDSWTLPRGRSVSSPVSGSVVSTSPLTVDTDSGIRVTMSGQIRVSAALSAGQRVLSGAPVATSLGGSVELKLVKLAVSGFGERSIRPSYLYLAVDRRK